MPDIVFSTQETAELTPAQGGTDPTGPRETRGDVPLQRGVGVKTLQIYSKAKKKKRLKKW